MNKKLKLTYIMGLNIRWVAHEWLAMYIDRSKFEVDFIILEPNDPLQYFLAEHKVPYQMIPMTDYAIMPEITKKIYDHLKVNQTDIVHTIFFQRAYYRTTGGFLCRCACEGIYAAARRREE